MRKVIAAEYVTLDGVMEEPGSGKRLFQKGADTKTLKLTGTKTFSTGIAVLTYEPAKK